MPSARRSFNSPAYRELSAVLKAAFIEVGMLKSEA